MGVHDKQEKIRQSILGILNIPVSQGSCGVIIKGGLNPIAIQEETSTDIQHFALSGLMGYNRLFPYTELKDRI